MQWLANLLWLIRQLVAEYRNRKHHDDVERIKNDPGGAWADRFGRVQPDSGETRGDELPTRGASTTTNKPPRPGDSES